MTEAESFSDLSQRLKDTLEALPRDLEEAEHALSELTVTDTQIDDAVGALFKAVDEADRALDAEAGALEAASDALTALAEAAAAFSGETARWAAASEGEVATAFASVSANYSEYALDLMRTGQSHGRLVNSLTNVQDSMQTIREGLTDMLTTLTQMRAEEEP